MVADEDATDGAVIETPAITSESEIVITVTEEVTETVEINTQLQSVADDTTSIEVVIAEGADATDAALAPSEDQEGTIKIEEITETVETVTETVVQADVSIEITETISTVSVSEPTPDDEVPSEASTEDQATEVIVTSDLPVPSEEAGVTTTE